GCECGRGLPVLERLDGRPEASVVVGDGRCVPSSVFGDLLGEHEFAVRRWQVVQRARDHVIVRVVRSPRFGRPAEHTLRPARAALAAPPGGAVAGALGTRGALPGADPRPGPPGEPRARAPRGGAAGAPRGASAGPALAGGAGASLQQPARRPKQPRLSILVPV